MLEKFCDILVIGNELPGLVTSAFLARRGLSVQVIETDLYTEHAKLPDPVCLCNTQSKLLRSILGRLNIPEMTIQNFLKEESTLQVIFRDSRIDVQNNPLHFFEEIEREFPKEEALIKKFYEEQVRSRHQIDVSDLFQRLIPHGWKERRNFKKFIKAQNLNEKNSLFKLLTKNSPKVGQFLHAQHILAFNHFFQNPFNYQISELFNLGDGEIFSVHQGIAALKRMLKDRIVHYDGSLRKKHQIRKLLFRNGVFEGVELDDADGNILCKYLIWNMSPLKLAPLLPKKWRFFKLRNQCKKFKHPFCWFTARFEVLSDFIPEPMKENVIFIDDPKKELVNDNFLYIQLKKSKFEKMATVDVNFLLPTSSLNEDENYFAPYFTAIREKITFLMPFSESSLKLKFPLKSADEPTDTLFPLNDNDFDIFKHNATHLGVGTIDEGNFLNLIKMNYKTTAPNFYITHPHIFSGFGLDSKLILGLKVTDLIWHEVEKVKRRAMRSERRIAWDYILFFNLKVTIPFPLSSDDHGSTF